MLTKGESGTGRARGAKLTLLCALSVIGSAVTPSAAGAQVAGNGVGSQFELAFWQSVATSDDRSQLETYVAQYPNGTFAALARVKIVAMDKREALERGTPAPAMPVAPAAAASLVPVVPATPAVTPAAAAPMSATMTAASADVPSLSDQLRALGQSQGMTPAAPVPATALGVAPAAFAGATPGAGGALPVRPQLATEADLALPDHFCSAIERNAFYDTMFAPAKDVAEQNNQLAIAHMQKLRQMYDALAGSQVQNAPTMNVIAGEAREYEAVAADAYRRSAAYEGVFARMMAVPVRKCS
jgi:hypothetical protein